MEQLQRIVGFVFFAAVACGVVNPATAQSTLPEYDLESLGEDMGEPTGDELCHQFTIELQRLAGCNASDDDEEAQDDDPSLEGVTTDAPDGDDGGASPFNPVDPTQDMINGLPGGGGGFDPLGQAIDDLTGGLFLGDQP